MALTIEDVRHVAILSRLEFNEKEEQEILKSMNQIVDHINTLQKIDTSKQKDNSRPFGKMRADVVVKSKDRKELLKCAPESNGEAFVVPRVVE